MWVAPDPSVVQEDRKILCFHFSRSFHYSSLPAELVRLLYPLEFNSTWLPTVLSAYVPRGWLILPWELITLCHGTSFGRQPSRRHPAR
jgi:hypothetical protein